jgi:hypothetical protein
LGSVTLAEEKNSIGEYSMSTQSVSCPDLIRLVGGVTDTFDDEPVPAEVLLPPQPAATRATPAIRADSCVRIVVGYTMMQTYWQ